MSATLSRAVCDIARVMARDPATHAQLAEVFILLTESLAATHMGTDVLEPEATSVDDHLLDARSDVNAQRFAAIRRSLSTTEPAEVLEIIRARTGWSRATYFRAQFRAKELSLIP